MLAELFLQTALTFLSREVPRWPQENHCYSCHNNGDAARALYSAQRRGYPVPETALADTTAWLMAPAKWDEIHGAPVAGDKKLARIQFGAALAEAYHTGAVSDDGALRAAAESLVKLQDPDGSWRVDTGGLPGAPATYGTALATYMTRRTLLVAGRLQYAEEIGRATLWLEAAKPASVVDAAALLVASPGRSDCRSFCGTRRPATAAGARSAQNAGRGVRHRNGAAGARRSGYRGRARPRLAAQDAR